MTQMLCFLQHVLSRRPPIEFVHEENKAQRGDLLKVTQAVNGRIRIRIQPVCLQSKCFHNTRPRPPSLTPANQPPTPADGLTVLGSRVLLSLLSAWITGRVGSWESCCGRSQPAVNH